MNKEKFEAPEIEVIMFGKQDILTVSGTGESGEWGDDEEPME